MENSRPMHRRKSNRRDQTAALPYHGEIIGQSSERQSKCDRSGLHFICLFASAAVASRYFIGERTTPHIEARPSRERPMRSDDTEGTACVEKNGSNRARMEH
jgi:hypothetical protein